jgi:hypothetical protein
MGLNQMLVFNKGEEFSFECSNFTDGFLKGIVCGERREIIGKFDIAA